jgi:hypothetical protein
MLRYEADARFSLDALSIHSQLLPQQASSLHELPPAQRVRQRGSKHPPEAAVMSHDLAWSSSHCRFDADASSLGVAGELAPVPAQPVLQLRGVFLLTVRPAISSFTAKRQTSPRCAVRFCCAPEAQ